MPWTTPKTWVTGEVLTASDFNAQFRDNLGMVRRKISETTATVAVANTVAETVLCTHTVPAGAMGTVGIVRLAAWGDGFNNTGAQQFGERLKLKLGVGATVVIDTDTDISNNGGAKVWHVSLGATRVGWRLVVEVENLGAANSQLVDFHYHRYTDNGNPGNARAFLVGLGATLSTGNQAGNSGFIADGRNTSAIDTTAAMDITVTVINPVASANFDMRILGSKLELIA